KGGGRGVRRGEMGGVGGRMSAIGLGIDENGWSPPQIRSPRGSGRSQNLVVADRIVESHEGGTSLGLYDCQFRLVARKRPHRIHRVPQREHQVFDLFPLSVTSQIEASDAVRLLGLRT